MSGIANELDEIAGGLTVACEAQVPQVEQAVTRLQAIARELRQGDQGGRFHAARASRILGGLQSVPSDSPDLLPGLIEAIAHAGTAQALAATPAPPFPPDAERHAAEDAILAGVANGGLAEFIAARVAERLASSPTGPAVVVEDLESVVQRAIDAWRRTVSS